MRKDTTVSDDKLQKLVENLKSTLDNLEMSKSAYLSAMDTTAELFGECRTISVSHEWFHMRGDGKYMCMFCTYVLDTKESRQRHIMYVHFKKLHDEVGVNWLT